MPWQLQVPVGLMNEISDRDRKETDICVLFCLGNISVCCFFSILSLFLADTADTRRGVQHSEGVE